MLQKELEAALNKAKDASTRADQAEQQLSNSKQNTAASASFSWEQAKQCLKGKTLWLFGNSVTRHWFFVLRQALQDGVANLCTGDDYRQKVRAPQH